MDDFEINKDLSNEKKINIVGTSNRYLINKLKKDPILIKRRKEIENWKISNEYFKEEMQLFIIENLRNNNCNNNYIGYDNNIVKGQIEKKLLSYKYQDAEKNRYDKDKFVTFSEVMQKLDECKLNCYYCKEKMFLLYDIVREHKQWTLDRINNDIGHNNNNVLISCLSCNLKRRKINKDAFLFTKQLNIIKSDV